MGLVNLGQTELGPLYHSIFRNLETNFHKMFYTSVRMSQEQEKPNTGLHLLNEHSFSSEFSITEQDLNAERAYAERRRRQIENCARPLEIRVDNYVTAIQSQALLINDTRNVGDLESLEILEDHLAGTSEAGKTPTRDINTETWKNPYIRAVFKNMQFENQTGLLTLILDSQYADILLDEADKTNITTEKDAYLFLLQLTFGWLLNKTKAITFDKSGTSISVQKIDRSGVPYVTHSLEVVDAALGLKVLSVVEVLTALLHDIKEKGAKFNFNLETFVYEVFAITLEDFEKRLGALGTLLSVTVDILTEMELGDTYDQRLTPEEKEAAFGNNYEGKMSAEERATAETAVKNDLLSSDSEYAKEILQKLSTEARFGRTEELLFRKTGEFGNLAYGIRTFVEKLIALHSGEFADNLEAQTVIIDTLIKPILTTEVLDRFKSDVATLAKRTTEKISSGKWQEIDVDAYFERLDNFMFEILAALKITGLAEEYSTMIQSSLANIQLAKIDVFASTGIEVTQKKIEAFRKIRTIVHPHFVTKYTDQKVSEKIATVLPILRNLR